MKLSTALLLVIPACTAAFAPAQYQNRAFLTTMGAKAAKSKEEDLELTRKVIARRFGGPAHEEKKPEKKAEKKPKAEEKSD